MGIWVKLIIIQPILLHLPIKLILCKFSFSNHRSSRFLKCFHIVSVSFPFRYLIIRNFSNNLSYIRSSFCRSKRIYTILIHIVNSFVYSSLSLIVICFIKL
nr:MAG TPA: hypothetical protein [Caudoviricetes sp.]